MRHTSISRYVPIYFILILISISSNLPAQYIKLTWNLNPENDIKYYIIHRTSGSSPETDIATVPATDITFHDYDIVAGQTEEK